MISKPPTVQELLSQTAGVATCLVCGKNRRLDQPENMCGCTISRPKPAGLAPGDMADFWHEGSQRYYRARVDRELTEEEVHGHPLEQEPDYTFTVTHNVSFISDKYVPDPAAQCSCGEAHRGGAIAWFCLKHGNTKVD